MPGGKETEHKPMIEIHIAGFEPEMKVDAGFFSIHPQHITGLKKTDLLIIPSIHYDDQLG